MSGKCKDRASTRASRQQIVDELISLADPATAQHSQRFFKTGPGEYGEGDRFLGIRVPTLRRVAGEHKEIPLQDAVALLQSPWHEVRLVALLLLISIYRAAQTEKERATVYRAYLIKHATERLGLPSRTSSC